ncbi:MAG: hypothetical protein ACKO0Z_11875 [Betaproteobacteria bacterium]
MEGDDGYFYETEAAWEAAYNEGCKAELLAILKAENEDFQEDYEDDFIGPCRPYANEEIPF